MNSLKIQKQNNHLRINIKGELAYQMFWLFEPRMKNEIEPFMNVEIHLNEVNFIDSSGVGFLLRIKNVVERKGGTFFVVSPSFKIMRVLKNLLLDTVFPVIEDTSQFINFSHPDNACEAGIVSITYAWNSEQYSEAALLPVA